MPLDPLLVSVLACPVDHEPLVYVKAEDVLYNPRRKERYRIDGTIPVLLPDEAEQVSDADAARYDSAVAEGTAVLTGSSH